MNQKIEWPEALVLAFVCGAMYGLAAHASSWVGRGLFALGMAVSGALVIMAIIDICDGD